MISTQKKQLQSLLKYAWKKSIFYQTLWKEAGIKEENIPELSITDLPIIDKKMLMENFDEVLTNEDFSYQEATDFLEKNRGKAPELFKEKYLLIRSSGSSKTQGIFAYDLDALSTIKKSVEMRMYPHLPSAQRKLRYAYLGAMNGNFAGETLARSTPDHLYEKKLLSVLDETELHLAELNTFQPDVLGGYASAILTLAKAQRAGKLNIHPQHINCGGDPLSENHEDFIRETWGCSIYNIYACSESLAGLGVRYDSKKPFLIFDDLTLLEVLGKNQEQIKTGEVVITNLYNKIMPIIRYRLSDIVTSGPMIQGNSTLEKIIGRENQHLPILKNSGQTSNLHSIYLACFFVPPLEAIQFVSIAPDFVKIYYESAEDVGETIRKKFSDLLQEKAASKLKFEVIKTDSININAKTGKKQLVEVRYE